MANENPSVISYIHYGWETSYAAVTTQSNKQFGHGTRITAMNRRNNMERVYGLGARNTQKLPVKQFEGDTTVEWVLANPWFFRTLLGSAAVAGGGPYTHTFTEADTIESFTIENNIFSDTKSVPILLGCKFNTVVITAAVNELVRVRADIQYADETFGSTTSGQVSETFELFTFANASFEFPNATTIEDIQNIELTMVNNVERVWGMGSRIAQKGPVKNREYTARFTLPFEVSATFLEQFYGHATTGPNITVAETATLELNFTNGLAGTNERRISMLFTGIKIDEHSLPQDPTALILEDVTCFMRELTSVIAINNTAAVP